MVFDILEAKQDRRTAWEELRKLNELVATEKRDFTPEEKEKWDKVDAEVTRLTGVIERQERLLAMKDAQGEKDDMSGIKPGQKDEREQKDADYEKVFREWLRGGTEVLSAEQRQLMQSKFVLPEVRQLGVATGAAGGFLVPQGFYDKIVESMRAYGGIRNSRCNVFKTTTGNQLPIPTLDDTANTGALITENTAITDLNPAYGQRILGAFMYTSRSVRVSFQLLQDSAFDIEGHLTNILGTRLGRITNNHFTLGTGSGQPQGVVTGSTVGVAAAAGNTTTVTYLNLVNLEHSVDPAYRNAAEFMFHDTTLRALKQLLDGQGRPLWLPGLAAREPDTLMGYRYVINQDVAQMAANARSILFGDFSNFYVRDVVDLQVLRLTERFAEALQVGFLAFSRHDAALLDTASVRHYQNSAT